MGRVEATGAINLLALDDLPAGHEDEPLYPKRVVQIRFEGGRPVFPDFARRADDPFLRQLAASGKKRVVPADEAGTTRLVTGARSLLRAALLGGTDFDPRAFCHRPLIVAAASRPLGEMLSRLTVQSRKPGDDVTDEDRILLWTDVERRILTGAELRRRLLRRIARPAPATSP